MSTSISIKRRPGGRTWQVARRVGDAVRAILEIGGYEALTLQAVADQAEVARATLYRRWPTRGALVLHGLAQALDDEVPIIDQGSLVADLAAVLQNIGAFLASRFGRAVVVASLIATDEDAMRRAFWSARSQDVRGIFTRAVARGEIDEGGDIEAIFAMICGSLYFRVIVMGEDVDAEWVSRVLELSHRNFLQVT